MLTSGLHVHHEIQCALDCCPSPQPVAEQVLCPMPVRLHTMSCRSGSLLRWPAHPAPSSSVCGGLQVKCKVGDVVSKGQVVVVLEAMKMEYPVTAPAAGQVNALGIL